MKKLLSLVLVLILCFSFAACGSPEETGEPTDIVNPITVYINILDNAEDDVTLEDFTPVEEAEFEIEEGTSVLDATQVYCVANDLGFELSSDETYFASIAGVAAGETTGWVYEVNGEAVMVGAGEYELKDGDTITWEFLDWSQVGF